MVNFSTRLQTLLARKETLTLRMLIDSFAEKSFSILFVLLMAIPALPLPTGGITHVFEIIVMLLAIELLVGRKTVWLPQRWLNKSLPATLQSSALSKLIKIIQWVERHSRPRLRVGQASRLYAGVFGAVTLLFTLFAFLAPPFSGLDTLPSLGVVLLSLGSILDDGLVSILGIIVGGIGIGLVVFLGGLVFRLFG